MLRSLDDGLLWSSRPLLRLMRVLGERRAYSSAGAARRGAALVALASSLFACQLPWIAPPDLAACAHAESCRDACEAGKARACAVTATAARMGWGVPQNAERFAAYARKGCDANDGYSCNLLFIAYRSGLGVARDPAKAVEYDEKSCRLGFANACNSLGVVYDRGENGPKDAARALVLFTQSCDGGSAIGCASLATKSQDGMVPVDRAAHAVELLVKECESAASPARVYPEIGRSLAPLCTLAAKMIVNGRGAAPDPDRAGRLFSQGCALGDPSACAWPDKR
jgi:TPR repeat protein